MVFGVKTMPCFWIGREREREERFDRREKIKKSIKKRYY
jgi:hypothetical protein